MKYPYIGEGTNGSVILFYSSETGLSLNDDVNFGCLVGSCLESGFFNITSEHLSNTWGIVESKEHAEFIIELCKTNNISVYNHSYPIKKDIFSVNKYGMLFFHEDNGLSLRNELKQITIPLPPRRKEFPKQVIATGKIFNRDSDDLYRWVSDCGKMEVIRPLESLEGDGDFTILSCESSSDEWPKVGDEVEAKHDSDKVLKGELLAITNEYAIIQQVGHEQHLHLSAWKFSKQKHQSKSCVRI